MLHRRKLTGRPTGPLLDAVRSGDRVDLFFALGTDPARVAPGPGIELVESSVVAGAPRLACRARGTVSIEIAGEALTLEPAAAELDLLAGRNVALAYRNGEDAAMVLDWLAYHADRHGLTGAVIVDRARPGSDPGFAEALSAGLGRAAPGCVAVLVEADRPLGRPDLPPEAHPYCAPDAPGKARMDRPPPDPWAAPSGEPLVYEIARTRWLDRAEAVAAIDVSDLLDPDARDVFAAARAAADGAVPLGGRAAYPWRLVTPGRPVFGDHICVAFDSTERRRRWCVAPARAPDAVWRPARLGNRDLTARPATDFYRCMALRHPGAEVSQIVPKSSLVEHPPLLALAREAFGHAPARIPALGPKTPPPDGRRVIVTTMKNEGPFILEWVAYHRMIGVDDILVYTNDCTDGTDALLDLLQTRGLVRRRDNPYRETALKPQHAAFKAAESEPMVRDAAWIVCMDVDEYINIKTGDGTLAALFAALPDANMIAMTWRLFGNADNHAYEDRPVTEVFTHCAPELTRKPHQAWGFKTLFRNEGIFRKLGVHRPKGLNPQLVDRIAWVNGSGRPLPRSMYRNAWRSTLDTYGYDLVQLNHYAVRSAESFLVKRDRGRVNHVSRDQGLAYWFRMNANVDRDRSIQRMAPGLRAALGALMADPDIAAAHRACVAAHHAKITELRSRPDYAAFYGHLTGARMEKLSRLHPRFGANVFLSGPDAVPDEILARDPAEEFFFTVPRGTVRH